jgi:amino acid transporter
MTAIDPAADIVAPDAATAPHLERVLGTVDLLTYGMIFMVPIAPFAVFGFVLHDAHGMIALAYLIGMVCMVFTAMSYAAMSRAFPSAGSVYTYAQRGLSEAAGFFAGWLILLDYILVPALLYIVSAAALKPLLPEVPGWVWLVGFIGFNCVVNVLGVEMSAKANRWLLLGELIVLVLFVIVGLIALDHGVGSGRLTLKPLYDASQFSIAMALGATSVAVLSFLGFDGISTLGEEAKDQKNGVARATLLSLVLVGVLFMIQTWIAAELAVGREFADLDSAFYEVAEAAGGTWLKNLTLGATVVAAGIANAMAAQAAISRVLYAMARDRKLPGALARLHPRFNTPYVSTVVVAIISLAVGLAFSDRLEDLSKLVNFGALSGFLLLHLAVVNHFVIRGKSRAWIKHVVAPLVGFVIIAFVIVEMDRLALTFGSIWLAFGIVYYLVLTKLMKRSVQLEV